MIKKNQGIKRKAITNLSHPLFNLKKKDLKIFMVCVLAATMLWFFNALNRERTEVIAYPIHFKYDKKHYVEVSPLPSKIYLSVKGSGWQIMKKVLRIGVTPIVYELHNPINRNRPYLVASQLRRTINNRVQDVRVEDILTDTISVVMDKYYERDLEVCIDSSAIALKKNHRITSKIHINPTTVKLTGPEKSLRQLSNPFMLSIGNKTISADVAQEVPLHLNITHENIIHKSAKEIEVAFQVTPFIEQKTQLIVNLVNFPTKPRFKLHHKHQKITVTYLFKKEDIGKIRLADFKIVADFKSFRKKDSTVALSLQQKPSFIQKKDIHIHTKRVKLDDEKK